MEKKAIFVTGMVASLKNYYQAEGLHPGEFPRHSVHVVRCTMPVTRGSEVLFSVPFHFFVDCVHSSLVG